MTKQIEAFKELVFEIAFGDDAINKEYSEAEVIAKLREFSDKALWYEELEEAEKQEPDEIDKWIEENLPLAKD